MAQSALAGMTDYSGQTLTDIKSDIEKWIKFCHSSKHTFQETIAELKAANYWEAKIPCRFRAFCLNSIKAFDTICSDFEIIVSAINTDNVTKREIDLMINISQVAHDNEAESWKSFKNFREDGFWHEYDNPLFKKAESLYEDGRNLFATLFDVSNAATRMEDYMKNNTIIQNNTDNSIHIGDNNTITQSQISTGSKDKKKSWFKKWWWAFIVPILVGVIVELIVKFMV